MAISKSTTKSLYAPSGSTAWTLQVGFTESSTSSANNTSTISLSCYLQSGGGSFSSGTNNTLVLVWHDNKDNLDRVISILNVTSISANGRASTSGTYTATHKADGSLSGYAKVVWTKNDGNSWTPPSCTYFAAGGDSPSYTALTAFATASVPTLSKSSFTLGEAITINTNRKSSSFTHTIRIKHSTINTTLATKTTAASYSMTSAQASNFQAAVLALASSAKSYSVTFEVDTFNGNTQVGSTQSVTGTANLTAAAHGPTYSSGSVNPTDIVKDLTTATVSVSVSHASGATISSVSCTNGAQTVPMTLSNGSYSCQMSNLTSKDFTVSATDSRGLTTSTVISANSYSEYLAPAFTSVTYSRGSNNTGTLSFSGIWSSASNSLTNGQYRVNGGSPNSFSVTTSGDTFSGSITLQNIAADQDYLVELSIEDSKGSSGTYSYQIGSDKPLFWLGKETARCGKHWIFEGDGQNGEIEIYPSANGGIRWGGTTITKAIFDTLPSGGGGGGGITQEVDPTVPAWAKASTKPTYTASEVGAIPAPSGGSTGQFLQKTASGTQWATVTQGGTAPLYGTLTIGAMTVTGEEAVIDLTYSEISTAVASGRDAIIINTSIPSKETLRFVRTDSTLGHIFMGMRGDRVVSIANKPSSGNGEYTYYTIPTSSGSSGTDFAITDGQNVYPFIRAVELTSSGVEGLYLTFDDNTLEGLSYFLPDGVGLNNVLTSVNQAIAGKIDMPSGGSPEYFLKKTASGVEWSGIPGGADEIAWTGGNLGQQTAPADVEGAITAVFNYINSLDASNTEY